jgi:hypothetical protein
MGFIQAKNGPDFIGIGVQRGGTTWLYKCLNEHPSIFLPRKEVNFFKDKFERGYEWYNSLFEVTNKNLVTGEITPDYMFDLKSMGRIAEKYPKIKIIIILRDPFERAFSAYKLYVAHGRYQNMTFQQAVEVDPWIIKQSMYFSQLKKVFELFRPEQIRVYDFDDISYRPLYLLRDVFGFLGVEDSFCPESIDEKVNVSGMSNIQKFVNLPKIQKSLHQYSFGRRILRLKQIKIIRELKTWLLDKSSEKNLKNKYCSISLRKAIREDLQKTAKLLNKNFEKWY